MNEVEIYYKLIQGGQVPGGHNVIYRDNDKNPFITPMRECNSIALKHTDVVVDIGAYVGTYAIRAARFPVKKVTAYEPTKQTYDILKLSEMSNLEVIRAAIVGDPELKTVELNVSKGIGVTNSLVHGATSKAFTETVQAISYEEATKDATIVKIDVEGAEYQYSGKLVQPKMRAIVLDFHKLPKAQGDWVAKSNLLIEEMLDHDFKVVIQPVFDGSGWLQAGSWIRETEEQTEVHVPKMTGQECCGCGVELISQVADKSLCPVCAEQWLPKHKKGFNTDCVVKV